MHVIVVEFRTRPEHFDSFLARVQQQARDSLELEAECHQFDVCVNPEIPNFVLLYEVYTDSAAFEAHLESRHFAKFNEEVGGWVVNKHVRALERT